MPEISFEDTSELLEFEIKNVVRDFSSEKGKALREIDFILTRQIEEEHLTGGTTATRLATPTGRLRSSITSRFFDTPEGLLVIIGTNVIYAATHEFGDPDRNIPERSFLRSSIREKAAESLQIVDRRIGKVLA